MSGAGDHADASDKSEGKISSVSNSGDQTIMSEPTKTNAYENAESVTQVKEDHVETATVSNLQPIPSDSTSVSNVEVAEIVSEKQNKVSPCINETEQIKNKEHINEKTDTVSTIGDDTESQDDDLVLKWDDDDDDDMLNNVCEKFETKNNSEIMSNVSLIEDIPKNYDSEDKKGNISPTVSCTGVNVSQIAVAKICDEKAMDLVENIGCLKAFDTETMKSDELQKKVEEIAISDPKQTESVQSTTEHFDNHTAKQMRNKTESLALITETPHVGLKVESDTDLKNTDESEIIENKSVSNIEMSLGESVLSLTEPATHGLNQPNNMIEIPTQELLDISDNLIDSSLEESKVKLKDNDSSDVATAIENMSSPVCNDGATAMTIEDFIDNNQEVSGNINESLLRELEKPTTLGDTEIPQNISIDEINKSESVNQEMEMSVEEPLSSNVVSEKNDSGSVPQLEEKMSIDAIEEIHQDLVPTIPISIDTGIQAQKNDDKFDNTAGLPEIEKISIDNDNLEPSKEGISTTTSTGTQNKCEIQALQSDDMSSCHKTETNSSPEKQVENMSTDIEESNKNVVSTLTVAGNANKSENQKLNLDNKCVPQIIITADEVDSVTKVIDDIAIKNKVNTRATQKEIDNCVQNSSNIVTENKMEIVTQGAEETINSNINKTDAEVHECSQVVATNSERTDVNVDNVENKDSVLLEISKTLSRDKPVTTNALSMEVASTVKIEEFKSDSDQKEIKETEVVKPPTQSNLEESKINPEITTENTIIKQENENDVCSNEAGAKSDENQCIEIEQEDIESNEPTPSTSKDAIAMDTVSDSKTLDSVKDNTQTNMKIADTAPHVTDLCPANMEEGGEETTAADMTDSLGLLAESSRVRDDADDDQDQDSDRDDYDDDFDQDDENSSQMVDQSEDSAQHSETDIPRVPTVGTIDKDDDTQDCPEEPLSVQLALDNETALSEEVTFDVDMALSGEVTQIGEVTVSGDAALCGVGEVSLQISDVVSTDVDAVQDDVCQMDVAESDGLNVRKKAIGDDKRHVIVPNDDHCSRLRQLLQESDDLLSESLKDASEATVNQSPSKLKRLVVSKASNYVNIVDLGDGSSDDDVSKQCAQKDDNADVTNIDISSDNEVTSGNKIDAASGDGDTAVAPKAKKRKTLKDGKDVLAAGDGSEVFTLDSDDEDSTVKAQRKLDHGKNSVLTTNNKCVNNSCTRDSSEVTMEADAMTRAYYESSRRSVCRECALVAAGRTQTLLEGIKNFTPLLELDMSRPGQQLVEILDSESDDETDTGVKVGQKIGQALADELQMKLAGMINETWVKYDLDERLKRTEEQINIELNALELDSAEVQDMLAECQLATDRLRSELYATFESQRINLAPLVIVDTPESMYSYVEPTTVKQRQGEAKRRLSGEKVESPKKQAVSDAPDEQEDSTKETKDEKEDDTKADDDKDVSVVKLCAESAPSWLPRAGGVASRPALRPNMQVYGMRNMYGLWHAARLVERVSAPQPPTSPFTMCRVRFDLRNGRSVTKVLPARCLAYYEPADARITIGTRVIALFKDNKDKMVKRRAFYSGVIAEIPNPVNKYRYLVFFDDGYAQYVKHADTRLVCEFSSLVWEEVHPFSREFVKEYLLSYPERPMVRLHTGQTIKTEWNGKWWVSKVLEVDASLVHVYFEQDKRTEWIYRGSTRLAPLYLERQNAGKTRNRPLPRNRIHTGSDMPYVEYTRTDADADTDTDGAERAAADVSHSDVQAKAQNQFESLRNQRSVAKKSTTIPVSHHLPHQPSPGNLDSVTSRVVYYTPKNAIRPHKMVPHSCGPHCKRTDVLALKDLRTYNPLAKPLLSGWERQIVRFKGCKEVMYRAPCGRRVRNMAELHRYLTLVQSDMPVDLFHFGVVTHCLAEFVLNKCIVGKKDLSHGKENVPVPCVNYYDDTLPEFCFYNTERTPTAGVPLNLDPDFLCGCDCTDDCEDKSKCACWQMTLEGARTIGLEGEIGYVYKRLPDPLPSGIYECNVRCKCRQTCLNRVAQHPLQLKLQVFKTLNRGWGIRALNDVPKGTFLCVYAGNLLTDATANLDGLNEGDEYLAELDYIEVVEQMKEGFEDDVPKHDKKLDKQDSGKSSEESSLSSPESEDDSRSRNQNEDCDFEPGYIQPHVTHAFSKRLRKRKKKEQNGDQKKEKDRDGRQLDKDGNREDDCITISDDEELREPASLAVSADMGGQFVSKYRSVRSHFGTDEACYIMDAKVQGNIGRYLNHSCCPNVFVQNVFVDTHDPRFPWVAFFALNHIKAGTELTWNYNYDIGSVPNKVLYCYCGAVNCRGRLL